MANEAGRGRKQCPQCQTYQGVRTRTCACGFSFNGKLPEAPKSGHKGKKQCPQCQAYQGVRTQICACGWAFDGSQPVAKDPDEVVVRNLLEAQILTPSGKCPVPFEGNIQSWVSELCSKHNYAPSAIKYFLRHLYLDNYQELAQQVDACFGTAS